MFKNKVLLLVAGLTLAACSSHPVLPQANDVKVSRENPSEKCKNLGFIEGRSDKINAKREEALEDLKSEAVRKGANYVRIETMGAHSSVRGTAFFCD